jgi:hypothetical protein
MLTNAASGGNSLSLNVGATGNALGANTIALGDDSGYRIAWNTSTGNVGIGTTSPVNNLQIGNFTAASTATPVALSLGATYSSTAGAYPKLKLYDANTSSTYGIGVSSNEMDFIVSGAGGYGFFTNGNSTPGVKITSSGSVGIGTTNPQHLLSVNGSIGALEVVVVSSGADYVFDPGYRLAPLSEVAEYIKANQHLPGIPAAKETEERGVSVGDMQSKLLAKIEELTLHMIEAEKENQALRDRVARLEASGDKGATAGSR